MYFHNSLIITFLTIYFLNINFIYSVTNIEIKKEMNDKIDELINEAIKISINDGLNIVPIKNMHIEEPSKIIGLHIFKQYKGENGHCSDLSTISRIGDLESLNPSYINKNMKQFSFRFKVKNLVCVYDIYKPRLFNMGPTLKLYAFIPNNELQFNFQTTLLDNINDKRKNSNEKICFLKSLPSNIFELNLNENNIYTEGYLFLHYFYDNKAGKITLEKLSDLIRTRMERYISIAIEKAAEKNELCHQIFRLHSLNI